MTKEGWRNTTREQLRMYYGEFNKMAEGNELFMEFVRNGEMSREQLARLIKHRPSLWSRFSGFLDILPSETRQHEV